MAINIMGQSISQLRRWQRGQPLDHRQLNEPVEALNRMMTGVGPPRQAMARVGGAAAVSATTGIAFAIVNSLSSDPDVLFVRYLDESGEPSGDAESVMVWPNMTNADFQAFMDTDVVLPIVTVNAIPYAMQLPRWDIDTPPSNAPSGDCDF